MTTAKQKIWPLPGGVTPIENKHQSTTQSIEKAPIPKQLILPLQQHVGNPAKVIINVGDHVLKGQQLAQANGFISVPVHAPTSGTITAITEHPIPHPSSIEDLCVFLTPDGKDQWSECTPITDYENIDPKLLIEHIRQAGIAGLGGAGFPTSVKLSPREHANITTLIINGIECEPYITSDDMLMRERAADIISGIKIFCHLLQPKTVLIGVEENKPEAINALEQAIEKMTLPTTCNVIKVPTVYPSGGEKQLIYILTGKEVPSAGIPADVGIVCQNVGTTAAVHRVVHYGEPLISRITTITGQAIKQPRNLDVLIGTPINELLNLCGFEESKLSRLIMGGPMMGFALNSAELPVIKTTNCIIAATQQELPEPALPQPCIRCGLCAEACPVNLLPQQLYWHSKAKDFEAAQEYNLFDCIECGACSYVCPSNIPLVQYYRFAKGEIRQLEQEKTKADISRQRFEFHTERITKEQAEKEAKRQARAAAAKTRQQTKEKNNKSAVIADAVERTQAKKLADNDTNK